MIEEWENFKRGVRRIPRKMTRSLGTTLQPQAKMALSVGAPSTQTEESFRTLLQYGGAPQGRAHSKIIVNLLPPQLPDDVQLQRRLQAGKVRIEARLDLHHMTESEAFHAVQVFISKALQRGWRVLLIITGRGAVLQAALPRWVQEGQAKRHVRWLEPAATRHGGVGAYYIMLRRINSNDK